MHRWGFAIVAALAVAVGLVSHATAGTLQFAPASTPTPGVNTAYSSYTGNTLPGGYYPYYPSSPYHVALPSTPNLISTSASIAIDGTENANSDIDGTTATNGTFNNPVVSEDGSASDGSDPIYYTNAGDTGLYSTSLLCGVGPAGTSTGKYLCDNTVSNAFQLNSIMEFWNTATAQASCTVWNGIGTSPYNTWPGNGNYYGCAVPVTQTIPPNAASASDTDGHFDVIKTTETYNGVTGYEINLWFDGTAYPARTVISASPGIAIVPSSGYWQFAAGGACNTSLDGYACAGGYATKIPGSEGLIRASDILYCLTGAGSSNPNCTLPTALSVAPKCNGKPTGSGILNYAMYPASTSDTDCVSSGGTNYASATFGGTEGERGCVNVTDSYINAQSWPDYAKVVWRTVDCSHFGFFNRDTNYYGGPGIVWQYEGGSAYYRMGNTDPWYTLATYETARGGGPTPSHSSMQFTMNQIPIFANSTTPNVVWCAPNTNNTTSQVGGTDGLCD